MCINRSISISHLNCCTLSVDTWCCHVQISSPNRFKFSFRKTFSNVNIYTYFFLLDTLSMLKVLLHDSVERSRVLHPRKKANGPLSFNLVASIWQPSPNLQHFKTILRALVQSLQQVKHQLFTNKVIFFASLLIVLHHFLLSGRGGEVNESVDPAVNFWCNFSDPYIPW